jgi:tetratricopeptide (TPR) repeat protein
LERALANQVISGESHGTKQEIYFQYAEELYKKIFLEFADSKHPLSSSLTKIEPFPKVYEESLHALIKCYRNANDTKSAHTLIDEALGKYQELGKTSGYYLSRIHYEHGKIEMLNKEPAVALEAFIRAEESNKGKFLSSDQRLDLWIQQAMCNKYLGQMDKAMLILSKVINDDAVSGQRLKAMFLRAEIYELQGRPELARKQLEATAKKGGDWAHKAKVKLDNEYGY